jgi:hypothetical protein
MIFPIFDKVPDKDRLAAAGKLMEIVKLPLPELYQWVMKHAPAWYYSCLLFSLKSVPGAYGNDDMSDVIEEGFANGAPECMEAALIAAAECGLTSRFNVTCASLTASHIEQLRVAAVRAINPDEKGADVMLSTFEKIMFLKKVAIFSNLDSHALKILSGISCVAACAKGEIIFEEGEFGDAMYIIRAGAVRLYLRGNQAKPLAVLKESQYFGEMAVLAGEPRSATAAADTDCTLIRIQRDHFIELIREYPLITLPIFKALTHRIREMQK